MKEIALTILGLIIMIIAAFIISVNLTASLWLALIGLFVFKAAEEESEETY